MKMYWNLASFLIEKLQASGTMYATLIYAGCVLLCMVVSYLLGSLNFGVILSHAKYKGDIREHGSGNAGTTNMLRTYGKGAAAATMVGDMLKAVVAIGLGYILLPSLARGEEGNLIKLMYGPAIASLFVVLGHMFPCFFKFKGGKGVACALIVVLMTDPLVLLIVLIVWLAVVLATRYVSLGAIMSMIVYPIFLSTVEKVFYGAVSAASGTAVILAVLIIFMHRENIKRLRAGTESKLTFKKKKAEDAADSEEQ